MVKLAVYAEAVTSIQGRLAPLFVVVRQAAATEPGSPRCGPASRAG